MAAMRRATITVGWKFPAAELSAVVTLDSEMLLEPL